MKTKVYGLVTSGVFIVLAALGGLSPCPASEKGQAASEQTAADPKNTKRADDEAAVRKATADFIKLVEKGDAKAVANLWTEDGEYIADDGTVTHGRAAIEAAYAKASAREKRVKLD